MDTEPIDLAQYAAERGNPWFGLGNILDGTTTSNTAPSPVTVESLEAIFKQFPPMDVLLPTVDFANIFNHTFTPEVPKSALATSMFDLSGWWSLDQKGRVVWTVNGKARRVARWQKIRKRQRRAAQRRHNRGEQ